MQSIDQNPFCWVEELLYEWGKWRPINHAENGYKNRANFAIKTSGIGPDISDDDGKKMDAIISGLKLTAIVLHDLAVSLYIYGMSCNQAGMRIGVGETKAKNLKNQLLAYVAAKFSA